MRRGQCWWWYPVNARLTLAQGLPRKPTAALQNADETTTDSSGASWERKEPHSSVILWQEFSARTIHIGLAPYAEPFFSFDQPYAFCTPAIQKFGFLREIIRHLSTLPAAVASHPFLAIANQFLACAPFLRCRWVHESLWWAGAFPLFFALRPKCRKQEIFEGKRIYIQRCALDSEVSWQISLQLVNCKLSLSASP